MYVYTNDNAKDKPSATQVWKVETQVGLSGIPNAGNAVILKKKVIYFDSNNIEFNFLDDGDIIFGGGLPQAGNRQGRHASITAYSIS